MTTLQELREAVDAAKEKEIGRHSHHWIEELFCKDCRKPLTKDEIFNMGYNWAISELRAIISLAQTVLDSKDRVEKRIIGTDEFRCGGCGECEGCKHYWKVEQYQDAGFNAAADQANAIIARKEMEIAELKKEISELEACYRGSREHKDAAVARIAELEEYQRTREPSLQRTVA